MGVWKAETGLSPCGSQPNSPTAHAHGAGLPTLQVPTLTSLSAWPMPQRSAPVFSQAAVPRENVRGSRRSDLVLWAFPGPVAVGGISDRQPPSGGRLTPIGTSTGPRRRWAGPLPALAAAAGSAQDLIAAVYGLTVVSLIAVEAGGTSALAPALISHRRLPMCNLRNSPNSAANPVAGRGAQPLPIDTTDRPAGGPSGVES